MEGAGVSPSLMMGKVGRWSWRLARSSGSRVPGGCGWSGESSVCHWPGQFIWVLELEVFVTDGAVRN